MSGREPKMRFPRQEGFLMLIGIDSFFDRLDLTDVSDFQVWNGGQPSNDPAHPGVIGGEAAFAGRNFLGDRFIWAHGEATNALAIRDPWDLTRLTVNVPRIAPIQQPDKTRQSKVGERGRLFGAIDGRTICNRIASGARAGEFVISEEDTISVWLGVDPDADFAYEYWSGWANEVNSFVYSPGPRVPELLPFSACILCRYTFAIVFGRAPFARDPHVGATLDEAKRQFRGLNTTCHDFWADALNPNDTAMRPGPKLDFDLSFGATEMPTIWRFSRGFRDAAGNLAPVGYSLDVVREPLTTSHMLKPLKWQPSATNTLNTGFSNSGALDADAIDCVDRIAIPEMWDFADEAMEISVPGRPALQHHQPLKSDKAMVVGRYLRHPTDAPQRVSMDADELERLSNAELSAFVVWQRAKQTPRTAYFATIGRGTEDATLAFSYCCDQLRVPPHTIIYFAVDYDAGDPSSVQADIDSGKAGGPHAEAAIAGYFEEIAAALDAHVNSHPDRPYRIGVYGSGTVLEWCYTRGIVSGFWQSVSFGAAGNEYGKRPWGHASRWQYQFNGDGHHLPAVWDCTSLNQSIDPDVDWGDGGQWNQRDRPARELTELEDQERSGAILRVFIHQVLPGLALLVNSD
jgi:hypothetical protein